MVWLMFLLGLFIAIDIFLIGFLFFLFKDPDLNKKLYDNFKDHVAVEKKIKDPSNDIW